MPITLTFDIETSSVTDSNDRTRINSCFERLGWEHIGGTAWRYPRLGTQNVSEDWLNQVIPALMYFRAVVEHAAINVPKFTIDAHSEAGYRGNISTPLGSPILNGDAIQMYPSPSTDIALSEERLRKFIRDTANSLG